MKRYLKFLALFFGILSLTVLLSACGMQNLSLLDYKVQSGDTLAKIANNYNVTESAIKLMPDNAWLATRPIKPGDILKLPPPPIPPTSPAYYTITVTDDFPKVVNTYVAQFQGLKSDEVANRIALHNGITNRSFMRIGQILGIPIPAPPTEVDCAYYARKIDTADSIALFYYQKGFNNVTAEKILSDNKLPGTQPLPVGMRLSIILPPNSGCPIPPDGATSPPPPPTPGVVNPSPTPNTTSIITYTVQSGDTLWGIAQRYNTTLKILCADNKLVNPNHIWPGQQLKIRRDEH